jgi:cytochrome bd-type quinol oxidase subunit 2
LRAGERVTPIVAALSAVATLACCLPIGGAALVGIGGLLGVAAQYQEWLFPASGVLLVVGGVLIWRSRRVCHRTSKVSLIILAVSTAIVLTVFLFPQMVAGALTDWLS